ncbi:MAG: hypothetical protein ACI31G_02980 [Bacilli bacterium]
MNKKERKLLQLVDLLRTQANLCSIIESLPKGYISVKKISGHTYYYRQWREGKKILSSYVEEAFLPSVKSKILLRKNNEDLLRITKKDLRNVTRSIITNSYLTEEQLQTLKDNAKKDLLTKEEREAVLQSELSEFVSTKLGNSFVEGLIPYNQLLLVKWNLL